MRLYWCMAEKPDQRPLPAGLGRTAMYKLAMTLVLFFEALGLMLQSGVPILVAVEVAGSFLPKTQQEEWTRVPSKTSRKAIRSGPAWKGCISSLTLRWR